MGYFVMDTWFFIYSRKHYPITHFLFCRNRMGEQMEHWNHRSIYSKTLYLQSNSLLQLLLVENIFVERKEKKNVLLSATIYLIPRISYGISSNTKSNLNCFMPLPLKQSKQIRQSSTYAIYIHNINTYSHSYTYRVYSIHVSNGKLSDDYEITFQYTESATKHLSWKSFACSIFFHQ